jgi:hypothetical protein
VRKGIDVQGESEDLAKEHVETRKEVNVDIELDQIEEVDEAPQDPDSVGMRVGSFIIGDRPVLVESHASSCFATAL